jgi:hypothetical protein
MIPELQKGFVKKIAEAAEQLNSALGINQRPVRGIRRT